MKILFLDIDGVLNSEWYIRQHNTSGVLIDETRLEWIKRIVDDTRAEIVLSTLWKEHWSKNEAECDDIGREMNAIFAGKGLSVFDKTPEFHNDRKGEIVAWLNAHPDVSGFVVIDDCPFEEGVLKNHFVLTSGLRRGIDGDDAEKAISILNAIG